MAEHRIPRTASAYDYPLIIKRLLESSVTRSAGHEIVYRDLKRYGYPELVRRVARLANALRRLGVAPGNTVAVLDWDSHRYLEAFFAVPMMGAVLHTVNVRLSPEQILYTINHAEDDIVLVHADFLPLVEQIRDRMATVKRVVVLSDDGGVPASKLTLDGEYEALLVAADDRYEFPDLDENTLATTFYTTGTTGDPKGVYFSHRQLVLHTLSGLVTVGSYATQGRFRSDDVYMPITPMFHVHAWGLPYMATVLGVKQVYPGRYEPAMLLKLLVGEKVTFSHCVPTILHMLLTSPATKDVDLSGWKVVIGGAALPRGLAAAALARGIDICTGYGMSETCPILTISNLLPDMLEAEPETQLDVRCKTGLPIPLVDLRIVDATGRELSHDGKQSGEVVVRAPWLTQGYLKNPEASEALWRDGFLHTGDVGTIDERGYLLITDRIKDVIKSGGEWISSLAIESIVSQHPAVSEVAVIGVPDAKWGERPMALVVLKAGMRATEDELRSHVKQQADAGKISPWAVPEQVRLVESLDKTSVGKLNKKLLRQKYG